jgi:hypothetical protein
MRELFGLVYGYPVLAYVRDFGIEAAYSKLSERYAPPQNVTSTVVQSIFHPYVQHSLGSVESWTQVRGW